MWFGLLLTTLVSSAPERAADTDWLDLSQAEIIVGPGLEIGPAAMALPLLVEEVERRSGVKLQSAKSIAVANTPAIALLIRSDATSKIDPDFAKLLANAVGKNAIRAEGYEIFVDQSVGKRPTVAVIGADARGVLFGVGGLMRHSALASGSFRTPRNLHLDTAPAYPIRGHQLGYRAAANSYDAWDVDRFEAYFRDMLVFGCNSVELIPPMARRDPRSRHMPKSEWDMTVALSSLLDKYGMDVWLWTAVEHVDVAKPDEADAYLKKRADLFKSCKRIDALFVPGGDPGDTPPALLLPFLEKLTAVLHESHPKAQMWVSPQMFQFEELESFFEYLEKQQPNWLTGVVYGPWVWTSLEETRRRVPTRFKIRNYPDITHTVRCQFAVPDFDQAFAFTLGREPINPRPRAYARINQLQAPLTSGSISYSDGCNDDVNKMALSVLDWDPKCDVNDALRQYGRYFFGESWAEDVATGILALEDNLVGKAAKSKAIPATLAHWKRLETKAQSESGPFRQMDNWRFQQPLFRAYFDALVAARAREETELETQALAALREVRPPAAAVAKARKVLAEADQHRAAPECRKRVWELADALYRSIGMQLDTKTFGASGSERGAVLDYIDEPLNNRHWLEAQIAQVEKADTSAQAERMIDAIVKYEDPGPGGFYDDLGDPGRQPHLVRGKPWNEDPSYLLSGQCEHNLHHGARLSWLTQAETLYAHPLQMRYVGLDATAQYRLKIVYFGRFRSSMALEANGVAIHGALDRDLYLSDGLPRPVEFVVPKGVTKGGTLELTWKRLSGRGCQVAEIFLLKE